MLDTEMDRKGVGHNNNNAAQLVNQAMEDLLLIDVWRCRNVGVHRWSYTRKKPTPVASRIDYALVSAKCAQLVQSVFYVPAILTDHSAFFLSIGTSENK